MGGQDRIQKTHSNERKKIVDAFIIAGQFFLVAGLAYGLWKSFGISIRYRTDDLKPSHCSAACNTHKRRHCHLCIGRICVRRR